MAISVSEQFILELLNRARLDPAAEAARYGIALNEGVPAADTITTAAKQPLAMNNKLVAAAQAHSLAMINQDFFAHNNPFTGSSPQTRMEGAGYTNWSNLGENIAWNGSAGPWPATNQTNIEALHKALFVDAGYFERLHRQSILSNDFKEVGNGVRAGLFNPPNDGDPTNYNALMLTEDFGTRQNSPRILTGVAFNDTVANNDFYDMNEGKAGVQVKVGGVLKATGGAAGGYSGDIGNAAQTLVFSGGGMPTSISVGIGAGTANVKLDVVDGNTIYSSTNILSLANAAGAKLLGIANLSLKGGIASETLTGNRGSNTINGNSGNDKINGGTGGSDILNGDAGNDIITGASGKDTMTGGVGADDFDFNTATESGKTATTRDIIKDFVHLTDDIDVSTIDANGALAGNTAFVFKAAQGAAFNGVGQLRWFQENLAGTANDRTIIEGNTVGTTGAEFQIQLTGLKTLTAADFIL